MNNLTEGKSSVEERVVSVGDGGHGVDFEIFVGGNMGGVLDGSPVGEGWLGIVEPLVGNILEVIVVNVGNSLGNLGSWDSSSDTQELLTNLSVDSFWGLVGEEIVEEGVSSSVDLNIVQVVGVDGWHVDTAEVHLSGEDLVSEEVVSEKTSVGVGKVVAVGSGDIWEVSEKGMHGVVLLVDIIEVLSVLVDSVGSEHVLQKEEREVVFMLGRWSIIEDTNVGVVHLIISDHQKTWNINWSLGVDSWGVGGLWKGVEGLLDGINDLVVANITSGNNGDVVTVVVGRVEVSQVIKSDGLGQISISLDWLTEHVLLVGVEMNVFKGSLLKSIVVVLVLLADFFLAELELGRVEVVVGNQVSEDVDSSGGIVVEDLEAISSVFSIGFRGESSTHVLNLFTEFRSGSAVSSSGGHSFEKVGTTGGLESFVSRTSSDVDSDTIIDHKVKLNFIF